MATVTVDQMSIACGIEGRHEDCQTNHYQGRPGTACECSCHRLATPTKRPARLIANILYPDPRWSDEQRQMHRAARAIRNAMLDVRALYLSDVITLQGPSYHAYLAWQELERAIAPLFAEQEES